jgi:centromere protein I
VPELATFGATTKSVTIEELTSAEEFVGKLERVQFPSQMVSILEDRRLQFLFLFKGGEVERRRLDFWVSSAFVEGMEDGKVGGLLRMCAEFVEVTKECPACVEGFLRMYLKTWDGNANRKSVFDLLLCLVPSDLAGISRWGPD